MSTRAPARRYDSVQQDWRAFLPEAKSSFFLAHSRDLENAYLMLSVELNEAMDLRKFHQAAKAQQALQVTPGLCSLLVVRLDSVLHSMRQQARHFGIVPNLSPFEPSNFRTELGQRSARLSNLIGRVLLSERSQFIQKVSTVEEIVDKIGDSFADAIEAFESSDSADLLWDNLDACHFDLNTCLRETLVLLKSFLIVLPDEQVEVFDFTIRGLGRVRTRPLRNLGRPIIHARRMAALAGK